MLDSLTDYAKALPFSGFRDAASAQKAIRDKTITWEFKFTRGGTGRAWQGGERRVACDCTAIGVADGIGAQSITGVWLVDG